MSEFDSSITAYFGGDTTGLNKAAGEAGQTLEKLSNKIADKVLGMRDISNAIAMALGINIEKISESVARAIAGVNKAEEEAFKAINAISTESADVSIKNMRARLDDEQKYQLALQNREKLQRKVDEGATAGAEDQLRLQRLTLELDKQESEIIAMEAKRTEEARKQEEARVKAAADYVKKRQEANDKDRQAQIDLLQGDEKLAAMASDIDDLQGLITAEKKKGHDVTQMEATLQGKVIAFNKESAEQSKKDNEDEEKAIDRQAKLNDRIAKAKFDQLSTSEKITVLEQSKVDITSQLAGLNDDSEKSLEAQADLQEINAKLIDLRKQKTNEESDAIQEVTRHLESIKDDEKEIQKLGMAELETRRDRILAAIAHAEAEGKITDELRKQLEIVLQIIGKKKEAAGIKVANEYGRTDVDLSDRELAEKLGNLKKQFQGAQAAGDTGAFFFQQKIAEVEFEIGRRASFRRDYQLKGEKAFNDFSAFDEQTLRNYIRPEDQALANKQANAIIELNQNFKDLFKGGG